MWAGERGRRLPLSAMKRFSLTCLPGRPVTHSHWPDPFSGRLVAERR